jgi:hypothetical protein
VSGDELLTRKVDRPTSVSVCPDQIADLDDSNRTKDASEKGQNGRVEGNGLTFGRKRDLPSNDPPLL